MRNTAACAFQENSHFDSSTRTLTLIWTQNARHKPETADSEARRARGEREREPREERARANEEREKEEKEENMENQKLFCWQCGDGITK